MITIDEYRNKKLTNIMTILKRYDFNKLKYMTNADFKEICKIYTELINADGYGLKINRSYQYESILKTIHVGLIVSKRVIMWNDYDDELRKCLIYLIKEYLK